MDNAFFLVCKKYFLLPGFIEALDLKGILNVLKKVLCQSWNALTLQLDADLAT